MGLGKSKAGKPGQMNGAFGNQPGFASAGQSPFGNGPLSGTGGPFGAPGPFGPAPGQFGASAATGFGGGAPVPPPFGAAPPPPAFSSNQMSGFPPFPPQPQPQGLAGFPPASLFQAPPMGPPMGPPSSGYPVSYPNQTFRPLIPGYAPAPGNDRRGNLMAQDHDQADRFYNDQHMGQMHQMPPMNQSVKSPKLLIQTYKNRTINKSCGKKGAQPPSLPSAAATASTTAAGKVQVPTTPTISTAKARSKFNSKIDNFSFTSFASSFHSFCPTND